MKNWQIPLRSKFSIWTLHRPLRPFLPLLPTIHLENRICLWSALLAPPSVAASNSSKQSSESIGRVFIIPAPSPSLHLGRKAMSSIHWPLWPALCVPYSRTAWNCTRGRDGNGWREGKEGEKKGKEIDREGGREERGKKRDRESEKKKLKWRGKEVERRKKKREKWKRFYGTESKLILSLLAMLSGFHVGGLLKDSQIGHKPVTC